MNKTTRVIRTSGLAGLTPASNTRKLIIEEVKRRGWKYTALPSHYGRIDVPGLSVPMLIRGTVSVTSNSLASRVMSDKATTSELLEELGFEVPPTLIIKKGEVEQNTALLEQFLKDEKTVVVKPNDSSGGKGIRVGITTMDDLLVALSDACNVSGAHTAVVQTHLFMNEFRILVFKNQVVAASTRGRAFLIGDGEHTARELILKQYIEAQEKMIATDRMRIIDEEMVKRAASLNKYDVILSLGERMQVDELATDKLRGAPTHIEPSKVHPDFVELSRRIVKSFAAYIVGVDLFANDITQPLTNQKYFITELNPSPGTAAVIDKQAFISEFLDSLLSAYQSAG